MTQDNTEQATFWSGGAGHDWVHQHALLDLQMQPILDALLARVDLETGQRVLDVGCGTGQSVIAAAKAVGPQGYVLGADISPPMLDLARTRAAGLENVRFECVDVAAHDFAQTPFDRVMSRFGVMFFADSVAAFKNIAAAMKPGAKIAFATWGQIEQNPWFTLPARIAKAEIGTPPKSDPDAPGPFALRDIAKVESILRDAGFSDVHGAAENMRFTLPGGARQFASLCTHVGPAAGTLRFFDADAQARKRLEEKLFTAFAALPEEAVPAEINFFTAVRR